MTPSAMKPAPSASAIAVPTRARLRSFRLPGEFCWSIISEVSTL
jgi:hypothetical protein